MQRNDSEDGGMAYKFHCDEGFRLNGPVVIHCYKGEWNGSKPNCEPVKGTNSSLSILASSIVNDNNNNNNNT